MLLPRAVEFLARGWSTEGPLDLSRLLVVVPTRQSGRRLREALAGHAAQFGRAVFPPRVWLPEQLVAPPPEAAIASRIESLLAWSDVLRTVELPAFRSVFPVDPPSRTFSWALALADSLLRVQLTLGQVGLRLGNVVSAAGAQFPEADRWHELGQLEQAYDARLRESGKLDALAARIAGAQAPVALEGIDRIVVLAAPDPAPIALTVLAAHARTLPVDVAVFAPPEEAAAFDEWGRPLTDVWGKREWSPPEFVDRVHLCANPEAQADRVVELARGYSAGDGWLGVGVADAEVAPWLETALAGADLTAFNPEGRPLRREGLYGLLEALAGLTRGTDIETVETLARCPDFIDFLQRRLGEAFAPADWLAGLDELRSTHLPADLGAAQERVDTFPDFAALAPALAAVAELRTQLTEGAFATGAAAALSAIFAGRRLDVSEPVDARLEFGASAWTGLLRECVAADAALAPAEGWELALHLFGEIRRPEDKPTGAVELQGWLELLWEDAPHLIIAGVNDGSLPEAVGSDPFLPEPLCEALGLRTNAARLARDAYQLAALAACRRRSGRLDLLVGRTSAAGDPRRPSRLLLRCADAELPARVEALFRAVPPARVALPWQRAWRLEPPRVAPPGRVGVTALADYLQCPFRFYLKHALRLNPVEPDKAELDAFDFGILCHAALEAMGRDLRLRDCTDPSVLRDFLTATLERTVRARYGRALTLPLLVQVESARQRLARAAEVQAEQRAQGWIIVETETPIALTIGGLEIRGRIDRIERHAETGAWRVLDYKTSDQPRSPLAAHCRRAHTAAESAPPYARFDWQGEPRVWTGLQLPLYLEAVAPTATGSVTAAYFNLPKATGETAVVTWEEYDEGWRVAARRCAEGIAAAVTAGVFWPPAEPGERDDARFAGYFHHGTAASVGPAFAAAFGPK